MTDFSPEMQRKLDAIRDASVRQQGDHGAAEQERHLAEQRRLAANKESIGRIIQDAKGLGALAVDRVNPDAYVYRRTFQKRHFSKRTDRITTRLLEGWALTGKPVAGHPYQATEGVYYDSLKPSHYDVVTRTPELFLVTMIGKDGGLYVVETSSDIDISRYAGTQVLAGMEKFGNYSLDIVQGQNMGHDNPYLLRANPNAFVVENIDSDAITQGMYRFAEKNRLS